MKKELFTQEIIDKKKDGYECTICLENIKLNQDINLLKCGHIFHYKCIENLVDHKIKRCPNCRCDLKTGEKQPNNQNNNLGLLDDIGEFDLNSLYDENDIPVDLDDSYNSFYDLNNSNHIYDEEDENVFIYEDNEDEF